MEAPRLSLSQGGAGMGGEAGVGRRTSTVDQQATLSVHLFSKSQNKKKEIV